MKKQKIKVEGIRYKYIINDHNQIEVDGILPYRIFNIIKDRLITKGIYHPEEKETQQEITNTKKRFEKWCNTELKITAEDKKDPLRNLAKQELERRGIRYE